MKERIEWYRNLNQYTNKGGILFTGSTSMAEFPVNELEVNFQISAPLYNRSIKGLTVSKLAEALDVCILNLKPSMLFLAMGEEECKMPDFDLPTFIQKYEEVLEQIKAELPKCTIYVIGLLPNCPNYEKINEELRQLANTKKCEFIDFSLVLLNQKESLLLEEGNDSLSPATYITILKELKHLFRNTDMGFGEVWDMISNWY